MTDINFYSRANALFASFNTNSSLSFLFQGCHAGRKKELARHNDCGIIIAKVESLLDKLISSVEDGTVTVATLNLLEKNADQFLKLGEIHQENKKISVSIQKPFERRISELRSFFALREKLKSFINFSNIFVSGR